jgi:hypothetical protein
VIITATAAGKEGPIGATGEKGENENAAEEKASGENTHKVYWKIE